MSELLLPPGTLSRNRRPRVGYALTITAAALFAVNGSVSKIALDASDIGTLRWTELRSAGGFVGLLIVLAVVAPHRLRIGSRRGLGLFAFYGIVGFAFTQWFYFVAIDRLPIGIGLLFEFTAPLLIALWARFAWHEPVRRRVWPALGLVLSGLALVAQIWDGMTLDRIGVAAGLLAAVTLAVYYLMSERLVGRRDPISVVCFGLGFATLAWSIALPWWSFPTDALRVEAALPQGLATVPVGALALWGIVLGTVVPFSLSVAALKHLPATTVGIVATFEPVVAGVVAWVWLGETLAAVQIAGGAVVLVGILLAETSR
ncbi:MAG: EamA family transporter [Thermoleophilia bacterium]